MKKTHPFAAVRISIQIRGEDVSQLLCHVVLALALCNSLRHKAPDGATSRIAQLRFCCGRDLAAYRADLLAAKSSALANRCLVRLLIIQNNVLATCLGRFGPSRGAWSVVIDVVALALLPPTFL